MYIGGKRLVKPVISASLTQAHAPHIIKEIISILPQLHISLITDKSIIKLSTVYEVDGKLVGHHFFQISVEMISLIENVSDLGRLVGTFS
jgi:hypothetical protein